MEVIYCSEHLFRKGIFSLDTQGYTFLAFSTLKVLFASITHLIHIHILPNDQNLTRWKKSEASGPPGKKKLDLPGGNFDILCV